MASSDGQSDWRSYDLIAEDYAAVMEPRMALPAADLVEVAGIPAGSRVLDVGTGTGVCAREAAKAVGFQGTIVGVDVSLGMLSLARRHGGSPVYVAAAAIDLPFPDDTFDRLTSCFSISHFTRYETALFDMLRVLRPGGRLAVSAWGAGGDEFSRTWRSVAEEFADRQMLDDAVRRAMPWDDFFSDPERLKDALREAGLREVVVQDRDYRFEMTQESYLAAREITTTGRFLRQMLGRDLWETFRRRSREVFANKFPPAFNDFRDVVLAVGTKP